MVEQQVYKEVNGVRVGDLFGVIDTIKKDVEIAKFQFRATNRWVNGMHNRAEVKGFYGAKREDDTREKPYVFDEDEPFVLLGSDTGANPVEYLLVALSGCLTTSLVAHAAVRGVRLDAVESSLEGDLDIRGFLGLSEEVRRGFQHIRVKFRIKSDASRETLEELVETAQRRSPVFDIVTNRTPVTVTLEQ
jgi:uncharacterized OsmC-like protein